MDAFWTSSSQINPFLKCYHDTGHQLCTYCKLWSPSAKGMFVANLIILVCCLCTCNGSPSLFQCTLLCGQLLLTCLFTCVPSPPLVSSPEWPVLHLTACSWIQVYQQLYVRNPTTCLMLLLGDVLRPGPDLVASHCNKGPTSNIKENTSHSSQWTQIFPPLPHGLPSRCVQSHVLRHETPNKNNRHL